VIVTGIAIGLFDGQLRLPCRLLCLVGLGSLGRGRSCMSLSGGGRVRGFGGGWASFGGVNAGCAGGYRGFCCELVVSSFLWNVSLEESESSSSEGR